VDFLVDDFMGAEASPRTKGVAVPGLSDFFGAADGPDDRPEWVVRGLAGNELAKVNAAAARQKNIGSVLEALEAGTHSEKVAELRRSMGLADDIEQETAKRLEMLVAGSVKPVCSLELAVKLAETRPVEFIALTNAVTELTGLGAVLKKKS